MLFYASTIFMVLLCFVPVIIAFLRNHRKMVFINLIIMVGGITMSLLANVNVELAGVQMIVLWCIAFIWSLNKDVSK